MFENSFTIFGANSANISKIKPLSPIRSSDRRKIADQIISLFGIALPNIDGLENDQNNQNPPTLTVTSVRNSLLPEGSLSARFTTTVGPDLSPISGTVYVGPYAGNDPRILWIKVGDRLIPTGWSDQTRRPSVGA